MKHIARAALAVLAVLTLAGPALAEYPDRPVKIIVATTPGGGYDLVGRLTADSLRQTVGGSFIVENVPGAGSLLGTRQAAKATPDGYTLTTGGLSNIVLNMGLYAKPGYDPSKDFVPIGLVYSTPYVLVARKDFPYHTLAEVIAAARAKPNGLSVGTAGPGTGQDVIASLFAYLAKVEVTKVPYRGSAPVYTDMMGGRVDMFFDALTSAVPQVEGKTVQAIVTLGSRRSPRLPDVPTSAEAGLPDLNVGEIGSWIGLFAPARTPPDIVAKLRAGLAKTTADPAFRQRIEASGADVLDIPGDKVQALVDSQGAKWLALMRNAGIAPQ